jgi:DNA-binding transcriptional LysR family regulator
VELRHIRYFLAVAEYLNFSKAAQELHLGVALFVRNKRRVVLTKAGRVFLDEARKLVVQAGHATEAARHAQKGESGFVRVGIASGLGGPVSRVVRDHCRHYPAVNIEYKDVFSSSQSALLHKREIDVGFLRPPVDQVNLSCELLFEEEFTVVLPQKHPLARRKSVRLKEIADEPLIIFDRNFSSGLYDKILGLYSRQGLTPHFAVTHVEAHEEAGAVMVASGRAIYIGVGALVTRSVDGISLASVKLNEAEARIEVYMAWRRDEDSTAVLSFLNATRRVFGRPPIREIV